MIMIMKRRQTQDYIFLMIASIILLLTTSVHSNKSTYKNPQWGSPAFPNQWFHSKKEGSLSASTTEELEDEGASSGRLIKNQTNIIQGDNKESNMSPSNKKSKLYNNILSLALNVMLGENDEQSFVTASSSDYYYPHSSSPGLLPLIMRIMFLSWITSFWNNNQDTQPFLPRPEQHYTFENLNNRYMIDNMAISKILNQPVNKTITSSFNNKRRLGFFPSSRRSNKEYGSKELAIVIDLHTHDNPSSFSQQVDELCDKVTFLIHYATMYQYHHDQNQKLKQKSSKGLLFSKKNKKNSNNNVVQPNNNNTNLLEVIFRLESPGGSVQDYALASAQIQRLRTNNDMNITVTVCVDKFAASGGCKFF